MTLQSAVDERVAVADLAVVQVDQLTQRLDPLHVDVAQVKIVEPPWPVSVEDVIEFGDHPFFAQRLVDLGLQAGAQPAELRSIADQLAQLTHLRRRHPRFREPTHPQQIGEQRGVADVVLHPPVLVAGDPQRVRQMQLGAALGDHIGRPVPAPRRLHRHLRLGAASGDDLGGQVRRRVVDPTP